MSDDIPESQRRQFEAIIGRLYPGFDPREAGSDHMQVLMRAAWELGQDQDDLDDEVESGRRGYITTIPETITAAQFQALCTLLWGEYWRPEAADALGVSLRNVQFWAAEPPARGKPIPPGVVRDLFHIADRRCADPEEYERIVVYITRHAEQTHVLSLVLALELSRIPAND